MTTGYLDLSDVDTQDLYDTHLRKKLYTEGVFLLAYNARLEWEAAVNKEIICKHKSRDVAVGVKNAQDDMHAKDQIKRNESFRALAAKDYRDSLEYEVSRDYGMLESSVANVRLTAKDSLERNASELLNNALQVSCCTRNVDTALVKAKRDMNKSLILLRSATKICAGASWYGRSQRISIVCNTFECGEGSICCRGICCSQQRGTFSHM